MESVTYKSQVCKRCRCQFLYERVVVGTRERSRRLCDVCVPIAKKEAAQAFAARRKADMKALKSGWKSQRDPFQDLVVRGYASVARIMGITPEAVRQLECSALTHARKLLQFDRLKTRTQNETH